MTDQAPLFPVHKIQVSFPMWIVDNFESEPDSGFISEKLLGFAKAFMEKPDFIKKNISFEFVEDNEDMSEEDMEENILLSREYVEFVAAMMHGGIIPPLQEETK
jgi:hypothetical protein